MSDDGVQQMLELAERLRASNGGDLDEAAIQAVAEATNAPIEYVRLALRIRGEKKKKNFFGLMKTELRGIDPDVRRYVSSGLVGTGIALSAALQSVLIRSFEGVLGVVAILLFTLGAYMVATAKDARAAAINGAIISGFGFLMFSIFSAVMPRAGVVEAFTIIPITIGAAIGSVLLNFIVSKNRGRLGLKDPVVERQKLLQQLVDLQTKLKSGEQNVTFLSVDIVGSTQMKALADPLSIEYTFNEYHQFVDRIVRKHGGRIHSTAGDGMTCAFDTSSQAFSAAKNIQAGMIELNTFGNKTGIPLVLRAGIHTGDVVTPKPGDIVSLNFAHVIDMAAHLQKVAPAGGIAVSEDAAKSIPGGSAAVGMDRVEVQGIQGFVWLPKLAATTPTISSPPPPPTS
jgi:class 3 adenylate cyclase